MTLSLSEKAVVIARRRKRKALPGYRQEAALRLKQAVTAALQAIPRNKNTGGETRGEARNDSYVLLRKKDLELARKRSHHRCKTRHEGLQ